MKLMLSRCEMSEEIEYRCFIGGLSWSTSDRGLKDAFEKFGHLLEAKVVIDKFSGRSRGFGFVTFDDKKAMEEAIESMNGMDLDGRTITVDKAQPHQGSGRDHDRDRDRSRDRDRDRGRDRDRDSNRDYGGGRGGNGGDCFKCGKPGHFARECPSEGARGGGRYGGREDRYGSSGGGGGGGGGGSRYGPDRNVVTVLDLMSDVDQGGAFVLDRKTACDCAEELELLHCLRSLKFLFTRCVFSLLSGCIINIVDKSYKQESSGVLGCLWSLREQIVVCSIKPPTLTVDLH
ncbi:hypothetical protein Q3G72_032444 [Acer saccharum]|nr:hypothetical protein Q3G72_032444 [Acer saccharum]